MGHLKWRAIVKTCKMNLFVYFTSIHFPWGQHQRAIKTRISIVNFHNFNKFQTPVIRPEKPFGEDLTKFVLYCIVLYCIVLYCI